MGQTKTKIISGKAEEASKVEENEKKKDQKTTEREPKVRGKNYKSARDKVKSDKLYKLSDAIKLLKEVSFTKFDSTVELHLVTKKEGINERVDLPHGGVSKKIEIADESTVKKLKDGQIDFDVLLATPEMMPKIVPFAKLLGPRGLMPNPKAGTLIKDKKEASKFSANQVVLKTEKKAPVIHTIVGKLSQTDKELKENTEAILDKLGARQVEKAYLAATMSPSIKLKI